MPHLFLSGVPASRKTHFGNWLRDNQGYVHIDMEKWNNTLFHQLWQTSLNSGNLDPFINQLLMFPKLVLTWGYPPSAASILTPFETNGFGLWWFDGNLSDSRKAWENREGRSSEGLTQWDELASFQSALPSIYGINIIRTLQSDLNYLPPEEICVRMGLPA